MCPVKRVVEQLGKLALERVTIVWRTGATHDISTHERNDQTSQRSLLISGERRYIMTAQLPGVVFGGTEGDLFFFGVQVKQDDGRGR